MSPIVSRARPTLALLGIVSGLLLSLGAPGPRPSASFDTDTARIDRESDGAGDAGRRFDQPGEAAAFYANRRTGPLLTRGPNRTTGVRPLSPAAYFPALQQMRSMPQYSSATGAVLPSLDADPTINAAPGAALGTWSSLGPTNQGGRTRALLIDPANPNLMYAGGVAGGVWRTTDAGANWTPLGDLAMANLAVVSLAFDPTTTNTIFAGTGEGFFNADAIRGAGIFKSTDAGVTWNQLPATNTSDFFYVNSLIVSPRNPLRMFAATRTGLFRSINGGTSWTSLVAATAVNGCTQVALQLTGATGFVFASCGNFAQGTVYRVPDDDVSAVTNVLSLAGQGRSSIAVAPSNQAVVYVMSAQATAGGGAGRDGLHGIYRSLANGDPGSFTTQFNGTVGPVTVNHVLLSNPYYAFSTCVGASTGFFNQGWYDNVIAVDPLDANRVWAGGIDLFRSDDGGANWGTAGYWWFTKGTPLYHHADQHGIVFHPQYNGTSNKVLFSLSDGGVERLDDARAPVNTTVAQICGTPVAGAAAWTDRNNGYATTQFYDGIPYPNGQTYFGGLQDNGTQRGTSASSLWSTLLGGDGGYVAVDTLGDANNANDVLFGEFTGLSIRRSVNGGASFASAVSGIVDNGFLFIAPFTMNQAFKQQLWAGGDYIWSTTNQGTTWTRASAVTAGLGSVSSIAAHPLDPNRVIAGMSDGYIHSNLAALSGTSVTVWPSTRPSTGYVSSVTWDPTNINVAYATISAFGATNLFKSVNAGASWSPSVGSGATALPQIPALSVVVNPDDPLQVYVGTDLGVFTSVDGGASWFVENTGFARVPVEALKMSESTPKQLFAFTHGRGAWRVTPSPAATTALPPSNFRILAMAGNVVTFAWDLPASGLPPTSLQLEGGLTPGSVLGAIPLGVTPSATLALPSGSFFIRLRTNASGVLSGPSNELLVHVNVPVPPSAPANLLGLVNGPAVSLAWKPTFDGGEPTGATLDVTGTLSASLPLGAGDTFNFPAVPTGTYTFTVRQTGAGGASGPSNPVTLSFPGTCSGAPQVATDFLAFKSGGVLYLNWSPPASGAAPTGYLLNVTGSFVGTFPMAGRSFNVAAPPGTFNFAIVAANPCGNGPPTATQTVSFP